MNNDPAERPKRTRKEPTTVRIAKGLRLFRTTYKDRAGNKRQAANWYIELRDHDRIIRRLPAFADKGQSTELARKIQNLVAWKIAGSFPDAATSECLEQLPLKLRDQLSAWGILDDRQVAASRPLADHLADYEKFLKARGRNGSYIAQTIQQIRRVFEACRWRAWSDVSASDVDQFLNDLREPTVTASGAPPVDAHLPKKKRRRAAQASRTFNSYLTAVKAFCRWMIKDRRAAESPLAHLDKIDEKPSYERRAFTLDEMLRLIAAAQDGPEKFGVPGNERALIYKFAAETGLRAKEIRELTVSRLSLDGDRPTVTAMKWTTKGGRQRTIRLRTDTASALRAHFKTKLPGAKAFALPASTHTAEMIAFDMAAAKPPIERVDASGRFAHFHSLRHTTGSFFNAAGTNPKVAQAVLGHSSIELTMGIYTHTYRDDEAQAVAALPDLTVAGKNAKAAT